MNIGDWVRRAELSDARRVTTKWHLIDSVVDDEPFTRCGRQFRKRVSTAKVWQGFETSDVMPLTRMIDQPQLCRMCQ